MLDWLDTVSREAGLLGLLVLFASSMIEYVFPPFPGDTITLAGGFYAVRGGWPIVIVFAVLMAGSLAGASIDYAVGLWVGRRFGHERRHSRAFRALTPEKIAEWEARFRRRGTWWLVANRFLPGIRGPIFFAAGMSSVPYARVLVFGGTSSLLWNALLFGVGYFVGQEADRVQALASAYGRAVSVALVVVAIALFTRWAWRRRGASSPGAVATRSRRASQPRE